MVKICVILLVAGCATLSPERGIRLDAGHRIANCVHLFHGSARKACIQEAEKFCRQHGQHETCGYDDAFNELYR